MHFVISLLLHLLVLFGMIFSWITTIPRPRDKQSAMYVPSYTQPAPANESATYTQKASPPKKQPVDRSGIAKPASISTASVAVQMKNLSRPATSTSTKVAEAIHLVGDKKNVPKPLIILLGKALTAHLMYPKIAMDFRLRGMALIGFVLHPDGAVTNVQLVQSSQAGVLDNEAVAAVNAISPVKNVAAYVDKPRPMVIGIIFN